MSRYAVYTLVDSRPRYFAGTWSKAAGAKGFAPDRTTEVERAFLFQTFRIASAIAAAFTDLDNVIPMTEPRGGWLVVDTYEALKHEAVR